jgi:hypothetical protein
MMPRKPDSDPSANADTPPATGMRNTRQATTNAAMTPKNAAHGAEMPRCTCPLRIAMAVQGDEVEQRQNRDRGDERGEERVPQGIVVLVVHGSFLFPMVSFPSGDLGPHHKAMRYDGLVLRL